jgi:signal transduction histidine kinase
VIIEVRDRGAGLDPDVAGRAFHPGVTSRTDGSGLGLPIALAIARQHEGDLSLVDREGGGAVARLVLP